MPTTINDLPIEVLRNILLFLDPASFLAAAQSCHLFRAVAFWPYTLFWHIDTRLCDPEDRQAFYRLYDHIVSGNEDDEDNNSINNTNNTISGIPNNTNNDENIQKKNQKPDDHPLAILPTLSASASNSSSAATYSSYTEALKAFSSFKPPNTLSFAPLSLSTLKQNPQDSALLQFYYKLLRAQLIGISVLPAYTLNLPDHFFSAHDPHPSSSSLSPPSSASLPSDKLHAQLTECFGISPDGSYLLVVKRGLDNLHFLYGYNLSTIAVNKKDSKPPNALLKPYLSYYYCWTNDRQVNQVVLSTDNKFLGVSYDVGYVQVFDLFIASSSSLPTSSQATTNPHFPLTPPGSSSPLYPIEPRVLFSRQYPSHIKYFAISARGGVLFLRAQRLGGLVIVNIRTSEEIDIPHYRLDLSMSLQYNDKVLMLSGWNETIIFGKATHSSQKEEQDANAAENAQDKGSLWDYFFYHVQNNISSYVPVERAVALQKPNTYLGFDCSRQGGLTVKVVLDEEELVGFKPLERVLQYGVESDDDEDDDDNDDDNDDIDDDEEQEEDKNIHTNDMRSTPNFTIMETTVVADNHPQPHLQENNREQDNQEEAGDNGEIIEPSREEDGNEDEEQDEEQEEEEEEEEEEEYEDISHKAEFPLFSRKILAFSDLIYCVTQDASLFAILSGSRIYLYVLAPENLSDGFATGYLPHRIIELNLKQDLYGSPPTALPVPTTHPTDVTNPSSTLHYNTDPAHTSLHETPAIRNLAFVGNDSLLIFTSQHILLYDLVPGPHAAPHPHSIPRFRIDTTMCVTAI